MTLSPDSPDRYDRILHAVGSAFDGLGAWPEHPRALETLADNVEQLLDAELESSERRTVRFQTRIDNARGWARRNLPADQQAGLLAALRGDQPGTGSEALEPDHELHAESRHPEWEYATTEGPRKQWDRADEPPLGDDYEPDPTWERNTDAGRDGWERFDYTEESYWRRRKTETPDA